MGPPCGEWIVGEGEWKQDQQFELLQFCRHQVTGLSWSVSGEHGVRRTDKYICCQGGINRVTTCGKTWKGRNQSDARVLVWVSGKVAESFTNLWERTEGLILRTRFELSRGYCLKELRSENALHTWWEEMLFKGMKSEGRPLINVAACRGMKAEEKSIEMEESGRPSQKRGKRTWT